MFAGDIAEARVHFDQAIALYDPAAHRQLAMRFGDDQTIATLSLRSWALWLLGYPEAALRDADRRAEASPRDRASYQSNVRLTLDRSHSDPYR